MSNTTLVGRKYHKFVAPAVMPNNEIMDLDIESYFSNHIGVIVFYPLDFTFVCPSELLAFDALIKEFSRLGVRVVGISVDSAHAHLQWRNMSLESGGIGQINFPLISDIDHSIMTMYGVQAADQSVALRSTYIIDDVSGNVIFQSVSDLSIGRSTDEVIRVVEALIASRSGQVCPANWKKGEDLMNPTIQGVVDYLKKSKLLK
ncbi:MAG: peroxiredoxin [Alphaproteobacteria bacterium]|nr:peroxiredoxin [Alphaproteobacteria bacterium]